jgi:hypothetical protein
MLARVRPWVQGIQVSAPFGKVPFALQVFAEIDGIDIDVPEPEMSEGETLGFSPPARRTTEAEIPSPARTP